MCPKYCWYAGGKRKSSASSTIPAFILPLKIRKSDRRSKKKLKYEVDTKKEEPCQSTTTKICNVKILDLFIELFFNFFIYFRQRERKQDANMDANMEDSCKCGFIFGW
jgi:hypothetical protein